ncbi:MAG: hypothetical protein AAF511_10175 [Pseudomonadota bacterium]
MTGFPRMACLDGVMARAFFLMGLIVPAPAMAIQGASADEVADVITVQGQQIRGQTFGDVEPELTLTEADIAAYGASSIGELLDLLSAETSSGRGRGSEPPVVLLNGRRVAGFREIGRYPAESLARVEIMPEEVSLQYGFAANQRVINFILKPNTTVTALEAETGAPTRGGSTFSEASFQRLAVTGDKRRSIDGEFRDNPAVFESERSLNAADSDARTLRPDAQDWSAGFSYGRSVLNDAVATFSGSIEETQNEASLGRSEALAEPVVLNQTTDNQDTFLGLAIASALAPRTWTATASLNRVENDVSTDRINGTGTEARLIREHDQTVLTSAALDAVLNDRSLTWAGAKLSTSLQAGLSWDQVETSDQNGDTLLDFTVSRTVLSTRANSDIPVPLPRAIPGEFSYNGNLQLKDYSDVGTLVTWGTGLTWSWQSRLQLIASYTSEEGAPSLTALQAPATATPNARVFDAALGEDVLATVVEGGNEALTSDQRDVIKVGFQLKPWDERDVRVNFDYTTSSIDDETRTFSLLTDEFEQAFSDRVIRSSTGALEVFDQRPVQVDETNRQEFRTALNWGLSMGGGPPRPGGRPQSAPQGGPDGGRPSGPPPGSGPPAAGSPTSGPPQAGPPRRSRAQQRRGGRPPQARLILIHTWTLQDEVIAPNGVVFDFLDGSGSSQSGGTPAHRLEARLNRWRQGLGLRTSMSWQSGTDVESTTGLLRYSDLVTVNASLSYELNFLSDQWIDRAPFLKEGRIRVGIDNIFDERLDVRDATGAVPTALSPDVLDPDGRTLEIEFRKRF